MRPASVLGLALVPALALVQSACLLDLDVARPEPPPSPPVPVAATTSWVVGEPYRIDGIWYYPTVPDSYNRTGIAGRLDATEGVTANGEPRDANSLAAAHRILPLPSVVRVENLDNGRAVIVRINDRGPENPGRLIALTPRAASDLGMAGEGSTARVRVRLLRDESRHAGLAARSGRITSLQDTRPAAPIPQAVPIGAVTVTRGTGAPAVTGRARVRSAVELAGRSSGVNLVDRPMAETRLYVLASMSPNRGQADTIADTLRDIDRVELTRTTLEESVSYEVCIGPLHSVERSDSVLAEVIARGYRRARSVVRAADGCERS